MESQKEQLDNFVEKLRIVYIDNRKLLKDDSEENLETNENFIICMKIAAVLFTVQKNKESFESFVALAADCDYDVNNFLSMYNVEFELVDGIKVPKLIPKVDLNV